MFVAAAAAVGVGAGGGILANLVAFAVTARSPTSPQHEKNKKGAHRRSIRFVRVRDPRCEVEKEALRERLVLETEERAREDIAAALAAQERRIRGEASAKATKDAKQRDKQVRARMMGDFLGGRRSWERGFRVIGGYVRRKSTGFFLGPLAVVGCHRCCCCCCSCC